MACTLNSSRLRSCKDAVGGIKKLHFVDFGDLGTVTVSDGSTTGALGSITNPNEITDIASSFTYHTYDVKGNSSLESTINSSFENGTTFFEQKLSVTLLKLTKEDNKELKLMAYGRPHVFVEDYKGQVFVVGLENGADVTGGTAVTGAAMGDLNGYTLEFTAMETELPMFIANPTLANPFAGMSGATASKSADHNA